MQIAGGSLDLDETLRTLNFGPAADWNLPTPHTAAVDARGRILYVVGSHRLAVWSARDVFLSAGRNCCISLTAA